MRDVQYTSQFKRDMKQVQKPGLCTLEELERVVGMLKRNESLPFHMKDHPLKGAWRPSRECHVKPDLLLVYVKVPGELHLRRLASHSELFG